MTLTSLQLSPVSKDKDTAQEQQITIKEILDENIFHLVGQAETQSYDLTLLLDTKTIVFDLEKAGTYTVDIAPLKSVLEDYALICESYRNAARTLSSEQVETIDMGRRGIHNQGAEDLQECLSDQIIVNKPTARRFFTLINLYISTRDSGVNTPTTA